MQKIVRKITYHEEIMVIDDVPQAQAVRNTQPRVQVRPSVLPTLYLLNGKPRTRKAIEATLHIFPLKAFGYKRINGQEVYSYVVR